MANAVIQSRTYCLSHTHPFAVAISLSSYLVCGKTVAHLEQRYE